MRETAGKALLDHAHLDRQTFGDADLARDLLDLFAAQCRRLLPEIADLARPAAERADLAHTLKGSALGIGAERVAHLSALIEDALRRHAPRAEAVQRPEIDALGRAVADTLAAIPHLR